MRQHLRDIVGDLYSGLTSWGRFWMTLGLVTLGCAAAMSYAFGAEISRTHAVFLVGLSVIAAFLPEAAYTQWTSGKRAVAVILALIAVPVLGVEFYSHAGYTAGLRGANVETATVQNARYDARQDEVREGRTSLAMWEKRLADIEAANGWAATVTAESLRNEAAAEERRGGCGPKCLAIRSRIAVAEERQDLTSKVEATKRVISAAREKAATTQHTSSAVAHQNSFLANTVALVTAGHLEPSQIMRESAQQSVNLAMAMAATGLPALAFFVAGLYRRREEPTADASASPIPATPWPQPPTPRPAVLGLRTTSVADLRKIAMAA